MARIDDERAKVLPLVEQFDASALPADLPPPHELVIAAGNEQKYVSHGLGAARMYVGGSPRHWFFVAPSRRHAEGLSIGEFGITNQDFTGKDHAESRFDHELALDADIKLNEDDPVKREMFRLMGGLLVNRVRKSGDLFFAGLEIRYRAINKDEVVRWTQLIYSKTLLRTQGLLREAVDKRIELPSWAREASKIENRYLTAENMALSALIAARQQS